jgi:hypothetical protein
MTDAPQPIELGFPTGDSALVLETNGDFVTLLSSRAAPPGTPLIGEFEGRSYRVKVRGCRKTEEDPAHPFRIEGRFQNLSRAQRDRILAARPPKS